MILITTALHTSKHKSKGSLCSNQLCMCIVRHGERYRLHCISNILKHLNHRIQSFGKINASFNFNNIKQTSLF